MSAKELRHIQGELRSHSASNPPCDSWRALLARHTRKSRPECVECGDADIAGTFDQQTYCAECIRPFATRAIRTAEEFVKVAEDLVSIAESYDDGASVTPVRVAKEHAALMEELVTKLKRISIKAAMERAHLERTRLPLGDSLLASAIQDALDDDTWGVTSWFNEPMALFVFAAAADRPEDSVYQLLNRLFNSRALKRPMNDDLRVALLGQRLRLQDLRKGPFRSRLNILNGLVFAHGLVRLSHLYTSLDAGHPPGEPYTAAERDLYRRLLPDTVRRTHRSFFWFARRADFLDDYNDRAEQLAALWLLHPVSPRLRRYMGMLHQAYVEMRDPEAVILCRSILERAVADTCIALDVRGDDRMNARLSVLESRGVLSRVVGGRARAVWQRGNKVIHQDPDFVEDSFETIEHLLSVLEEVSAYLAPPNSCQDIDD
jgi:hypothetical protein